MTDLITVPGTPDLAWMRRVHRPDELLHAPVQLPTEFGTADGKRVANPAHALCVRGDVACVHRGTLPGVAVPASDAVLDWAMWTFFITHGLQPVELLTRDGFERWVRDAPVPRVTVCTACDGTGRDPDGRPGADGLLPACPTCGGNPRRTDDSAAAVQVGPVRVLPAALRPFLPHLGGASIGLGVAPAVNGRPDELELHVRHVTDAPGSSGGDWRLTLLTL